MLECVEDREHYGSWNKRRTHLLEKRPPRHKRRWGQTDVQILWCFYFLSLFFTVLYLSLFFVSQTVKAASGAHARVHMHLQVFLFAFRLRPTLSTFHFNLRCWTKLTIPLLQNWITFKFHLQFLKKTTFYRNSLSTFCAMPGKDISTMLIEYENSSLSRRHFYPRG